MDVTFPSNGTEGQGYLAIPDSGRGPGVVVLQEWWGINDQIREVCDRFASEGFVGLAPDIYRGVVTTEPDEAAKLMMALNIEQAAKDMAGAVDFLVAHDAVTSTGVGVTGYCMGGGLALWLATLRPDAVVAVVPHYGVIPWPAAQPDYTRLQAKVQGHYAENDDFAGPPAVAALEEQLSAAGKDYEFFVYPGTEHAFTNHHRPEVFHEEHSETTWTRTLEFLRANVT
ncbi:MAG TPA: dienelactone hydrolase family protein [Acidimicrobiia bacterium]|nr:dienelactone hydrolase family protein [Acidimicrobiia bacterium]